MPTERPTRRETASIRERFCRLQNHGLTKGSKLSRRCYGCDLKKKIEREMSSSCVKAGGRGRSSSFPSGLSHVASSTTVTPHQLHSDGLLSYFRHGITNAKSDGFSSRIQVIKSQVGGFRVFENYRARILFYCGRLNFFPKGVDTH